MIEVCEATLFDRELAAKWMTKRVAECAGVADLEFPKEWLPVTALAAHRKEDWHLVMVAFLYLERSTPVAVCGWCVGNPRMAKRTIYEAARMLFRAMPGFAKQHGANFLMTFFGNRAINQLLAELGFQDGEPNEMMFFNLQEGKKWQSPRQL